MRKFMVALIIGAALTLTSGCGGSSTGQPVHTDSNNGVNNTHTSAPPVSSAPIPTTAPTVAQTTFDAATIKQLQGEADRVKKLTDQAFANRQSLEGKDATACQSDADNYNQTVQRLHLTADQLGAMLLPPQPLSCD